MRGELMRGALDGLRVLEFGQWIAGPYCGALLADLGADVVKIEKPGRGDDQRHSPPFVGDESALFMQVNRNKRSVVLDLTTPEDRERCRRLALAADVLVENFRGGTLATFGLGYEALAGDNPRLIYCAISGFGQQGPLSTRAGMDLIAQAMSGVMMLNAGDDGRPNRVPIAIADISTGLFATIGILAAVAARETTGRGQLLDLSLLDSTLAVMPLETATYFATGENPARYSPRGSRNAAPYQVFATKDGWIAVVAAAQHLWVSLCKVLECQELLTDPRFASNAARIRHSRDLEGILERILVTRTTEEWLARTDAASIPASPVLALSEILTHPHIAARGTIPPSPDAGARLPRAVVAPIGFGETPVRLRRPAPLLGEHSDEVLRAVDAGAGWPAARGAEETA